jgi:hypothetical protein
MTQVTVVIREVGRLNPDYSLEFELPEVPKVGSYISVHRPDNPEPYSEDMIVKEVGWRLEHPETRAATSGDEPLKIGSLKEILSNAFKRPVRIQPIAGAIRLIDSARMVPTFLNSRSLESQCVRTLSIKSSGQIIRPVIATCRTIAVRTDRSMKAE